MAEPAVMIPIRRLLWVVIM